MLDKLIDILMPWSADGRQDPVDFAGLDFTEVDLDEMSQELGLESKAISNGENEIPPSGATQLDGPQEEIRAAIKGRVGKAMAGYERRIKGLDSEIQSCKIKNKIDRLESADQELEKGLSDLENRLGPKIEEARASVENAERELQEYRSEHGIQREPEYPDSQVFQVGLLAFVCALEAFVNGFFFRQGMEEGIVGGAFIAFVLAAVDVGVVFWLAGYSVWSYYGLKPLQKIIGTAATAVALAWVLFYNLLTAHIREYLQADLLMEEATQEALDRFLSSPFGIEQADSIILIILGVVFSISAYYAGATWEEVIPYYGPMHKKLKERRKELRYWKKQYRRKAASLRDEKLEDVERILEEAEDKTKRLEELIGVKSTLLQVVSECVDHYRGAFRALVKRYRDINQRHRSTQPPGYFDEEPDIEFTEVKDYSTKGEKETLENQKRKLERKKSERSEIKERVRNRYEAQLEA